MLKKRIGAVVKWSLSLVNAWVDSSVHLSFDSLPFNSDVRKGCNQTVITNETSVEVCKTKKSLKFFDCSGLRPVCDCSDLNPLMTDVVPKKGCLLDMKLAFLCLDI